MAAKFRVTTTTGATVTVTAVDTEEAHRLVVGMAGRKDASGRVIGHPTTIRPVKP